MRRLLVTFFYAGLVPIAPGTAGSFAATAVLYALLFLNHPTLARWNLFLIVALLTVSLLAVWLGDWAVRFYQRKDPQKFVLDEVAGICLTNLFLPTTGFSTLLITFAAFRVFDVIKPPPCRQLESLPTGWGILLDDLAAGVYANLVCQLLLRVVL